MSINTSKYESLVESIPIARTLAVSHGNTLYIQRNSCGQAEQRPAAEVSNIGPALGTVLRKLLPAITALVCEELQCRALEEKDRLAIAWTEFQSKP